MARKIIALIMCLALALCTAALAEEEITYTLVAVPGTTLSVPVPSNCNVVFTRDIPADDPIFESIGLTKEFVDQLLLENNMYLDVFELGDLGTVCEITLSVSANPETTMDAYTDAELESMMPAFEQQFTTLGVTLLGYELYHTADHVFMLFLQEANGMQGVQCYTVQNNQAISLTLTNYLEAVDENDVAMLKIILDGMIIGQ